MGSELDLVALGDVVVGGGETHLARSCRNKWAFAKIIC